MSTEASMSRNLNAARALAAAGCPVFPCIPGPKSCATNGPNARPPTFLRWKR